MVGPEIRRRCRLDRTESKSKSGRLTNQTKRGNVMAGQRSIPLAVLAVLVCTSGVRMDAQGTGASITGTLSDATGAVVPGATVKSSSIESGRDWTTLSNEVGIYNLPALPPGQYTVSVE